MAPGDAVRAALERAREKRQRKMRRAVELDEDEDRESVITEVHVHMPPEPKNSMPATSKEALHAAVKTLPQWVRPWAFLLLKVVFGLLAAYLAAKQIPGVGEALP